MIHIVNINAEVCEYRTIRYLSIKIWSDTGLECRLEITKKTNLLLAAKQFKAIVLSYAFTFSRNPKEIKYIYNGEKQSFKCIKLFVQNLIEIFQL